MFKTIVIVWSAVLVIGLGVVAYHTTDPAISAPAAVKSASTQSNETRKAKNRKDGCKMMGRAFGNGNDPTCDDPSKVAQMYMPVKDVEDGPTKCVIVFARTYLLVFNRPDFSGVPPHISGMIMTACFMLISGEDEQTVNTWMGKS